MVADRDGTDMRRVGPGTAGGEFMRQYWIPCMMSKELVADGAPVRLPLLGEKLIAFRDTAGRVGVFDQRCPHRCASLFLGRNEEEGLRCVYHGWKFDVEGRVVDIPSVPEDEASIVRTKATARAYRAVERNGLVWVYMGKNQQHPPRLPEIEVNMLGSGDVHCSFVARDCNWLQSLEGDIDTAHFGFLHTGSLDIKDLDVSHPFYAPTANRSPKYEVAETPWGTSYGAYRPAGEGRINWRVANFLFPFYTQIPQGEFPNHVHMRAWVPIDDDRTMLISMYWLEGMKSSIDPFNETPIDGYRVRDNYLTNSTDWYGRFRLRENESNDWMIDREAQMAKINFTGIDNIHLQDQAVTESMGPMVDHTWEHLTTSDLMVARTRRRIAREIRTHGETGSPSPGVENAEVYLHSRAGFFVADAGVSFKDAYAEASRTVERPAHPQGGIGNRALI